MSVVAIPVEPRRKFMAVTNKANAELAGELATRVTALVHEYDDRIPLALAIGVLRIVESELIRDAA
jgi:hypothetical protein